MSKGSRTGKHLRDDMFAWVALWQFAVFSLLITLIWVNEVLDLPSLFFHQPSSPVDVFGASVLTICALLCAIITVGHTYLQQKRIIHGLLHVCSRCSKIQIDEDTWQGMDHYVQLRSTASFTHGLCPDCAAELESAIDGVDTAQSHSG